MKRPSPTSVIIGILVVLLLMAGSFYLGRIMSSSSVAQAPPSDSVVWDIRSGNIPPAAEKEIKEAISLIDLKSSNQPDVRIRIISGVVKDNWGVLYGEAFSTSSSAVPPTATTTILVHKTTEGWKFTTVNEKEFCQVLQQVPEDVLSPVDKNYFSC